MFPVYIDGIPAETRINMQTRLFYTSKELSQELERLSNIDSKKNNFVFKFSENFLFL